MSGAQTESEDARLRRIALESRDPGAAPAAGGAAGGATAGAPVAPVPEPRALVPAPIALTL